MGRKASEGSKLTMEDSMLSISDQSREKGESTAQLHVLAVDDSIIDRKVIEKLLQNSCYKVTTVDSGKSALEFLGLGVDHNAVNDLQESSKLKEIPVVVMSSENVSSRKSRCMDEGAEDFIVKPVQVSDVKRLRNYIGRVRE